MKQFILSEDVRFQKKIGLLTAGIFILIPLIVSPWVSFRTFQTLLCIGGGLFYAYVVIFHNWPKLSTVFIIEDRQIKSRRWGKVLCEVRCTGMVHYL